jgi:hypothetical protein
LLLILSECACRHLQVAQEFGIEGGLENFKLTIKDRTKPLILGIVSPSEKERAEAFLPDDPAEGAAVCVKALAQEHSLDWKLICSGAELREELVANWRHIHVFVFDTTSVDFEAWVLMELIVKHRREFVRTRPAIVVLNSEKSIPEKHR